MSGLIASDNFLERWGSSGIMSDFFVILTNGKKIYKKKPILLKNAVIAFGRLADADPDNV